MIMETIQAMPWRFMNTKIAMALSLDLLPMIQILAKSFAMVKPN